jgi:L-2-hydroxyglutarate oxidase
LASRYFCAGLRELTNSYSKRSYLKQVQRYCPQLRLEDLHPYPTGIRAQAVNRKGELIHDFLFAQSPRSLHVCNAPSPAATSAIPISLHISDQVQEAMADKQS